MKSNKIAFFLAFLLLFYTHKLLSENERFLFIKQIAFPNSSTQNLYLDKESVLCEEISTNTYSITVWVKSIDVSDKSEDNAKKQILTKLQATHLIC